jgi:hypothetical protein
MATRVASRGPGDAPTAAPYPPPPRRRALSCARKCRSTPLLPRPRLLVVYMPPLPRLLGLLCRGLPCLGLSRAGDAPSPKCKYRTLGRAFSSRKSCFGISTPRPPPSSKSRPGRRGPSRLPRSPPSSSTPTR